MADRETMALLKAVRKGIEGAHHDVLRELMQFIVERLMSLDVDAMCGAERGTRSEERVNQRNGYRTRRWDTRTGTIDLAVPKVRRGTYFPAWLLDPRRRSERALVSVVAECYVRGVSTRRVDGLVQTLGIEGISKSQVSELAKDLDEAVLAFRNRPLEAGAYPYVWLDALAVKCREEGRVVNVATVLATGVNEAGHREVLGVDVLTAEDGAGWTSFVRSLTARGLGGVQLAISDAHCGLKDAIAAVLPGAAWQRCRTHFMRNLLARVPKSAHGVVASLVRTIFEQPDADAVWAQHRRVVGQLEERFPAAAELLEEAAVDLLAFTAFPPEHWRRIWSNNPLERLNKELRRRTDVVGIFPNRDAILRLVGAVLAEQHDEWLVARRYLTIGSIEKLRSEDNPADRTPSLDPETAQGSAPAPTTRSTRRRSEAGSRPPQAPRVSAGGAKRSALTLLRAAATPSRTT